ncbi:HAD-IA family hydrolase [Pseudidiomarina insulisalsae]|uniref:Phosphoesterase n=1 Tax=Pseudidiomarina insulisalsae TaxID=575789 RepID=A0A432YR64_9GAMM|nr:HAD-IA family hydrolase [Pseudidiomarina insulisalsae]RUO63766.1 phosphoesterase [Pseudidiomarina insulisalsae]
MQFYRRPQPVAAISFDLDDTLYDNFPVMQQAEAEGYRALCERFPQAQQWTQQQWAQRRWQLMQSDAELGSDMTALRLETIRRGLCELGLSDSQARSGADEVFAVFLEHRNRVQVPPASHELLRALGERYPLVAISNGNVDTGVIGLKDYFDWVVQPAKGVRGKPHSDMFAAVEKRYPKLPASAWLHVGDSPLADILGAQRMGWQTAWFRQGLYSGDSLEVLPTLAFDALPQLQQWLLR